MFKFVKNPQEIKEASVQILQEMRAVEGKIKMKHSKEEKITLHQAYKLRIHLRQKHTTRKGKNLGVSEWN